MGRPHETQQLSFPLISFEEMAKQICGLSPQVYGLVLQEMLASGDTNPLAVWGRLRAEQASDEARDLTSAYR